MLNNLLHALFGIRTPSDLARSTQGRWDDWLQPIAGLVRVGVDPSYDDDFLALKDEVAKLSGLDDELIIDTAERLLKHQAKDLRPAVYYAYGRMRRDGAEYRGSHAVAQIFDTFETEAVRHFATGCNLNLIIVFGIHASFVHHSGVDDAV